MLTSHLFQDAQTASAANGTPFPIEVYAGGLIEVVIGSTAAVYFEFSGPITGRGGGDGNALMGGAGWYPLTVLDQYGTPVQFTTVTGVFRADTAALSHVRCRVVGNTSTVTVRGLFTDETLSLGWLSPASGATAGTTSATTSAATYDKATGAQLVSERAAEESLAELRAIRTGIELLVEALVGAPADLLKEI